MVRKLAENSQSELLKQISKFASVGVVATIIHSATALSLIHFLQFESLQSNVGAFFVATLFSYTFNSLWSFEKSIEVISFVRFILVGIINLGLIVALSKLNDKMGFPSEVSVLMIAISMPMMNFVVHKYWTFSAPSKNCRPPEKPGA